jgi:hypothetical protein
MSYSGKNGIGSTGENIAERTLPPYLLSLFKSYVLITAAI